MVIKRSLLLALLFYSLKGYSQEYVIEKVNLTETVEHKYVSEIPRLKDTSADDNPVVDQINAQILDRFMITSYEQDEIEEFRWYGVECTAEVNGNILYISFSGEYYGAYPNYVADEMFFDLTSGNPLQATVIPVQALFTLSGYMDFLNTWWLEGVKAAFTEAIECAESEPYCSVYDIDYRADSNTVSFFLTDDCYPHVAQGCSPVYRITFEPDIIRPYLNATGKYLLLEGTYKNMTPVEKFREHERLIHEVPANVFLFGTIGDKYPFGMALNLDHPSEISGFYYYDSKLQIISLSGQHTDDTMFLTETVNHKQTGSFVFDLNIDHVPIDGKWMNAGKTKNLDVSFSKIITCRNN
jgi:hypothetical protein